MLTDLLKWGSKRRDQPTPVGSAPRAADEPVMASKAFAKFVSLLAPRSAPLLLDFGPVAGGSVEFYGDRLGCKLFIEDLVGTIESHARAGTSAQLAESLTTRFRHGDGAVDGILCWDVFDFLDRPAGLALAQQIVRMLKPGGAVMALFCTSSVENAGFRKFEIVDENNFRCRPHGGTVRARRALPNRDIIRMFEGLSVSDSFLLKNNTREMLLRR
jgi:hypothetical protein